MALYGGGEGVGGGTRTYVGFGFGAIQAGLFLYEAARSGLFDRLVVAEIVADQVAALRQAGGTYALNIAHPDRVEQETVGPVEILNPAQEGDRRRLVEAIAYAHEIGTAIPSVGGYVSSGPGSLHRVLAAGLQRKAERNGPPAAIYAAENDSRAAQILAAAVLEQLAPKARAGVSSRVRFVNTVIGKMSGVVAAAPKLAPITPGAGRAFLVEAFSHILVSRIDFDAGVLPAFTSGFEIFEAKADLEPFEQAKFYGHNATHALAAYLGALLGQSTMAELAAQPGLLAFLRAAMVEETGAALLRRYGGVDPLFTPTGLGGYADQLIARMTNPHLQDSVARVGRDPARKLGWHDRLIGAMRLTQSAGIVPQRFALGAAAALVALAQSESKERTGDLPVGTLLTELWRDAAADPAEMAAILALIERQYGRIEDWRRSGSPGRSEILLRI